MFPHVNIKFAEWDHKSLSLVFFDIWFSDPLEY